MARARPEGSQQSQHVSDDSEPEPREQGKSVEQIVQLSGARVDDLFGGEGGVDGYRRLADPRSFVPAVKGDATRNNRTGRGDRIVTARVLGGETFARLERDLAARATALLQADDGADLVALKKAYGEAQKIHDEAVERYAVEAAKRAVVKRYEVEDNNRGHSRLVSTRGSLGQARLSPGKVVDSLNYDIEGLRRQGVKLKELPEESEGV